MVYKGRLKVAGEPGEGIPVDLSIDDVYVDLASGGENLGRWRMDVVELSRLTGNEFAMALDGEQMVFVAADPLGFAYNAVTTIEEISSRLRKKRGLFRKRPDTPRKVKDAAERVPTVVVHTPGPATDLDDLLPSAPDLGRLLPPPVGLASRGEGHPLPAETVNRAEPIESALSAESVVSVEDVVLQDADDFTEVEMPAPEPVESLDPVPTEAAILEVPEPVEVEGLVEVAGVADQPDEDMPPADVGIVDSAGADPGEPTSIDADGFELTDVESIDVAADQPVAALDSVVPEADAPLEPVDGAAHEQVAVPEPAEVTYEVHARAGTAVDPQPTEPGESASVAAITEVEAVPGEGALGASTAKEEHRDELTVAVSPFDHGQPDPSTHTDGAEPVEADVEFVAPPAQPPVSSPTPPAQARRRRFGRSRAVDIHVHDYAESKTVGGITRRVCGHCGHVSFAGEDIYEEWK